MEETIHMLLALRLFSLALVGTFAQQADAIMPYITFPKLTSLLEWQLTIDNEGDIWLLGSGISDYSFIVRFDRDGKKELNETSLPKRFRKGPDIIFDRFSNAYVTTFIEETREDYYSSIIRITSDGQVTDYYSKWPSMKNAT